MKLGLIAIGAGNAWWFHRRGSLARHDGVAKAQSLLSLLLWISVIACGRLIAYSVIRRFVKRRNFVYLISGALLAAPVLAHHGWSSFDQDKPLYLSGTLTQVRWQNPHTEVMLRVDATKLPDGIATRTFRRNSSRSTALASLRRCRCPRMRPASGKSSLRRCRACRRGVCRSR